MDYRDRIALPLWVGMYALFVKLLHGPGPLSLLGDVFPVLRLALKRLFERSMRYAFIHELCHTIFMNHSQGFWRLGEVPERGSTNLGQHLREVWKKVPICTENLMWR